MPAKKQADEPKVETEQEETGPELRGPLSVPGEDRRTVNHRRGMMVDCLERFLQQSAPMKGVTGAVKEVRSLAAAAIQEIQTEMRR